MSVPLISIVGLVLVLAGALILIGSLGRGFQYVGISMFLVSAGLFINVGPRVASDLGIHPFIVIGIPILLVVTAVTFFRVFKSK